MNYEEKYNAALGRAKEKYSACSAPALLEYIFPELKESEDERIKREILELVSIAGNGNQFEEIKDWLEKQCEQPTYKVEAKFKPGDTMRTWREAANGYTDGMPVVVSIDNEYYHCTNELIAIKDQDNYEFPPINVKQKPSDKVEPKFHPGDWVIDNVGNTYQIESATEIESEHIFGYTIVGGGYFNDNSNVRLWSINDAKDGDVLALVNKQSIFLFDGYGKEYCHYSKLTNSFSPDFNYIGFIQHQFVPATKEQRDLFFSKMKEEGWEWDSENKELKKNL